MIWTDFIRVQGRSLSAAEVIELQQLIDEHPDWSRHRVANEMCQRWDWQTPAGQLKTFAALSLLLKLEQRHHLRLPPVRAVLRRSPWGLRPPEKLASLPLPPPLTTSLESLQPLQWQIASYGCAERGRALNYLRHYHYLGCNRPVGTHLLYLVQDARRRDLAVHLVGAAAWHCAPRDRYIGWSASERAASLHGLGNHSRFLILPWVRVPHLASHLLGGLTRRIAQDWQQRHGWPLELLESFVESGRFPGLCYRAANWLEVGQTTGRTRQHKQHRAVAPRKSVWVYGLSQRFRVYVGVRGRRGGAP